MIQAKENTSKPTQTSLQSDPEKKSEHPNERAEFSDNRASIISQRKLSNAIGQKDAKEAAIPSACHLMRTFILMRSCGLHILQSASNDPCDFALLQPWSLCLSDYS